jgi:DNA polymerase-3 subunit epsilon/ATP-dependent DNA helicase DinG
VVSTNTINLQEQLLGKDVPALIEALVKGSVVPSGELRAATLKGRANYLCLRRLQTMLRSDTLTNGELRVMGKAFVWLQETATGDREEINLGGRDAPVWHSISAGDRDYCHGNRHTPCFLRAARERAESAHVLVVNHALLLADVARGGALLPKYDHLIVDEAQHLEEVATRQLGFQAGQRLLTEEVQQMSRLLGPMHALLASSATSQGLRDRGETALSHLEGLIPRLRDVWAALWAGIHDFVARHREENGDRFQMRVTPATRTQPAWSQVEVAWENIDKVLGEVTQHGYDLLGVLEEVESPDEQGEGEFALELSPWLDGLSELKGRLRQLLVAPESDQIYWVDQEESGYLTLHAAPENVGPTLEKMLFAKKRSVVLTSATLTVGGEFAHMRQRLGFVEGDELLVGSPFDYRRAALVLVPEDMPEPFEPGYPDGLGKAVIQVADAMEGRTLVLFTSHSALRGAARRVRGTLEGMDIKVLAQGVDGTARQLAEQFADAPRAVLLGTSSFWEGVDLPGDMLRALVLARLPFNVPTEPVFAARSEQYEVPFREYAVPQAVLRFRQGFGRLIRGEGDRGVVVILDRRVVSRNYGSLFLKSLPPCAIKRVNIASLAQDVQGWFGG